MNILDLTESVVTPENIKSGEEKLTWAKSHMPVLSEIVDRYDRPLEGKNVSICLHIEAKTGCLALAIKELGANVSLCGCNPLSTQDDVVAALSKHINVYGVHGVDDRMYEQGIEYCLSDGPDLIIDDGGDFVNYIHDKKPEFIEGIIGGCEETTTGITRLKQMGDSLQFPMVNINDADCKHLFDNRYGTGQSAWSAIMSTTNLSIAGKVVVVAGYGWVGKGIAMRAKALGARVIVTEIDEIKALEALMDGYDVKPMMSAAFDGDIFVTCTGNRDVIRLEHMIVMKDGAILCNAGHFDIEINKDDLESLSYSVVDARENIQEYKLRSGISIYLLGEGRLVNLACGMGHPVEIMDMSFSLQLESLLYLNEYRPEGTLIPVPDKVDREVAKLKLESMNKNIDKLTESQIAYLNSSSLNLS